MQGLIGEFEVAMDAKGRISLPVGLRKQLPAGEDTVFFFNRSLEQVCINLYTQSEWQAIVDKLSHLNGFNPKVEKLKRLMMAGSAKVELDSAGRLLIPKTLIEYVQLGKDLVIAAQINKIEIWDKQRYNDYLLANSNELEELANELFGNNIS
jgi:MraZ protein